MFILLHRALRKALLEELSYIINFHPYYSYENQGKEFQSEPIVVSDKFSFDVRQFPVLIIDSVTSNETRLAMNRLITEVNGYVRPLTILPIAIGKVETDLDFDNNNRQNQFYLIEIVNAGRENEEDLKIRRTLVTPDDPTTTLPKVSEVHAISDPVYFDISQEAPRTDIVPGAKLFISTRNALRPGISFLVQTFDTEKYLGRIYGSRHKVNASLKLYTQTMYQTEELLDFLINVLTYITPDRLLYGHGIDLLAVNSSNIEKAGEVGEEVFVGTLTLSFSIENQIFVPDPIVEEYTLQMQLRQNLDDDTGEVIWQY